MSRTETSVHAVSHTANVQINTLKVVVPGHENDYQSGLTTTHKRSLPRTVDAACPSPLDHCPPLADKCPARVFHGSHSLGRCRHLVLARQVSPEVWPVRQYLGHRHRGLHSFHPASAVVVLWLVPAYSQSRPFQSLHETLRLGRQHLLVLLLKAEGGFLRPSLTSRPDSADLKIQERVNLVDSRVSPRGLVVPACPLGWAQAGLGVWAQECLGAKDHLRSG